MEKSKDFNYIDEAMLTCSNNYHGDRVPLHYLEHVLKHAIDALTKLDNIKKTVFYGEEKGIPKPCHHDIKTMAECPEKLAVNSEGLASKDVEIIIHGIIGKATEAGELLELLKFCLIGLSTFDKVNAVEEIGDGFWYDAILLKVLGSDFESCQKVNIDKLRKRFPNKFTEFDAINRNLDDERETLEKAQRKEIKAFKAKVDKA